MEVTAARRSSLCDTGSWADRTALHEAASQGRALQLKQLIESGASVNMVTVDNITALHEACIQAHPNCVRMLLEAGAQVDVRTIQGSTPLCHACAAGSLACVKLLLKRGAKVNPRPPASPLHESCTRGNVEIVRLLITKGAELEACDTDHTPPLHTACAKGHVDCALELLNAGADVNSSKAEETALHHAACGQTADLIDLLVEFGGNTQARDRHGCKPMDYTKPSTPAGTCLKAYGSTPLSLQQLCRIRMRTTVGRRGLEVIGQLDISYIIRGYLQYTSYQTSPAAEL
ncbi:ankyrin repeat and SOCS box protein 13 [Gadus morhua]|uniref:Ankyrin repeat and SOCS box containing 13a, tandem duplicate 1 n=1 Tax=Gadus morhua TaxID=8049 RepID=A0A8C4YZU7_GADMO|nr:ankyrin repeat and SOCS box protein 13-like [Gadus morhua]